MSDKQGDNCNQTSSETEITLDTLPPELILKIFAYLDAKLVIKRLACVCRFFHSLINDKRTWKIRIGKQWRKKYPAIPVNDEEFDWKRACIEREEQFRLWKQHQNHVDYFTLSGGISATVDAVHLMKEGRLLAAGSRDRFLNLYDLSVLDVANATSLKSSKVHSSMDAHKGWIWSFASLGNTLCSGSWDTYVKFWDLNTGLQEYNKVKCNSALLCLHLEDNLLIAGSYDKNVYHIDPRTPGILSTKRYHRAPVLCMGVSDGFIVTGSEDKTISVYERRADKFFKSIQVEDFAMSMSYGQDQLWTAHKSGAIQLFDATDGDFIHVEKYDVSAEKMTGIIHTMGAIFTCSTDKNVRILEPNLKPSVFATLQQSKGQLTGVSFQNNVLAAGSTDSEVNVWKPRECT